MADEKKLMRDDGQSAEDDKLLSAYLNFINTKTELTSIEKCSYKNDHGTSSDDAVDKFEIFNTAFTKIENDANSKPLYKSIRVDIKELSPIKCQLLAKGRQRAHGKKLKLEIYWATAEKRVDDEMSAGTKLQSHNIKYLSVTKVDKRCRLRTYDGKICYNLLVNVPKNLVSI